MGRCECGVCQECNWAASHGEPPEPTESVEELRARIAELEAERDRLRNQLDNSREEAKALASHGDSVHRAIVDVCGDPDEATLPAVARVVADRDALRRLVGEQAEAVETALGAVFGKMDGLDDREANAFICAMHDVRRALRGAVEG